MNACPFPGENKKDRIQGIRPGSCRCRHPLSFCLRDRHVYIHGLHLRPSLRSLSRDMRVRSPLREQRKYYSTGPSLKTIAVSQEIHVKYRAKYRRNTERPGKTPGRAPWRRHHEGRTAYKERSLVLHKKKGAFLLLESSLFMVLSGRTGGESPLPESSAPGIFLPKILRPGFSARRSLCFSIYVKDALQEVCFHSSGRASFHCQAFFFFLRTGQVFPFLTPPSPKASTAA